MPDKEKEGEELQRIGRAWAKDIPVFLSSLYMHLTQDEELSAHVTAEMLPSRLPKQEGPKGLALFYTSLEQ